MSWDEDFVRLACQEFLVEVAIFSHCATCRSDEEPWNKDWKFVSNVSGFSHASLITDILHLLENGIQMDLSNLIIPQSILKNCLIKSENVYMWNKCDQMYMVFGAGIQYLTSFQTRSHPGWRWFSLFVSLADSIFE